jgi:anti-sigma factor RsiW
MTCRELADFIADYLTGEIPRETRAAFEHHLSVCPNCRQYLANYQATVAIGRRAFAADQEQLPPDVPEDLVKAILAARKP